MLFIVAPETFRGLEPGGNIMQIEIYPDLF